MAIPVPKVQRARRRSYWQAHEPGDMLVAADGTRIPLFDPRNHERFNPAIEGTDEQLLAARIPQFWGQPMMELECFFPPATKLIDEEGAWVTILHPPHMPMQTAFGESYWAVPYRDSVDGWREHKFSITIHTPNGEARLWPYEYCCLEISTILDAWSEEHFIFHPFAIIDDPIIMTERVFYAQSRGIRKADAVVMALSDIKQAVGWFSLSEEMQGQTEGWENVGLRRRDRGRM